MRFSAQQNAVSNSQLAESGRHFAAVYCGVMITPPPNPKEQPFCQNGDRAEPSEIWKARNFIREFSDEHLSLTRVARAAHISPNHLSEKFKQITGINFIDYIARLRIEKARQLLQDVDLRVSEIAFAVGFQSLSQFNRVFKKLTQKSPTQFRACQNKGRSGANGARAPQNFYRKNAQSVSTAPEIRERVSNR